MARKIFSIIVLTLLVATQHAHSWGREGHVIVARIAEHHLTDKARDKVQRLLDLEPDRRNRTLEHAAVWPDLIKNPRHPQHKQFAFARPMHSTQ